MTSETFFNGSAHNTLLQPDLVDSEARFRALVTATSDVVYRMSPDWTIMRALEGRGFLSDTGEPISSWLEKYIHPADQARVKAAIAEAIRDKKIFQLEHQVLRADGTLGWTFSRAVPIMDAGGEIIEWFGAANDISARHQMEDELREARDAAEKQKRLYETITSNTPDLIYVFDLNYRFTYANDALLTMWGKTWDTAIGKGLLENGYEPWHAKMHEREIDRVVATKQRIRGEVSFPHATLGRRIYDYIFSPVINAGGQVEAIAGTTRDITEIRNADKVLIESEARFRTMAEGTNIAIAVGDEEGNTIYFNHAWSKITGRWQDELLAQGWYDLLHPEDAERHLKIYRDALEAKAPFHSDFRVLTAEGKYRWLLLDGAVRWNSDSSFAGYISSAIDITEMKEDEQRKNSFISMVSHELKTPLTSSYSAVQLAKRKVASYGDPAIQSMLEKAEKQLTKMNRLINGFLNLSRLESGKIQINREPFDLCELLNEAHEEATIYWPRYNVTLDCHDIMIVNADREKLGQVIQNLISNAAKYSPLDTTISVKGEVVDGNAQVTVSDHGIGIAGEDVPKLFEQYFRVNNSENDRISGFGIGLYLCAEIINRHGGKIWAESEIGGGSKFHFSLPVA